MSTAREIETTTPRRILSWQNRIVHQDFFSFVLPLTLRSCLLWRPVKGMEEDLVTDAFAGSLSSTKATYEFRRQHPRHGHKPYDTPTSRLWHSYLCMQSRGRAVYAPWQWSGCKLILRIWAWAAGLSAVAHQNVPLVLSRLVPRC
jgi:hypothetical protein